MQHFLKNIMEYFVNFNSSNLKYLESILNICLELNDFEVSIEVLIKNNRVQLCNKKQFLFAIY